MSFWWWTWNNVRITGGWNIRRIQMKTPLCLLRLSLFAPSFAAAPQKLDFDGAQIKDELIKWSTFIPNKLWQVPPPLPSQIPKPLHPRLAAQTLHYYCAALKCFSRWSYCKEWNLLPEPRTIFKGVDDWNSSQRDEVIDKMWQPSHPISQHTPIHVKVITHTTHCSISESNVL